MSDRQIRSFALELLTRPQQTLDPTMKAIREHVFHEPRGQKAWQLMPELPAASEIMVAQAKAEPLPENPIDSAWASKDDYLETHYRLLRREGTEALRYAVNKYKSNPAAGDDEDMCIYTKVMWQCVSPLVTRPLTKLDCRSES